MKLTIALKNWLVENKGIKLDASDDEFRKAAGVALSDGTLTVEKFNELTAEKDEKEVNEFSTKLDSLISTVGGLVSVLTDSKKTETKTEKTEGSEEKSETTPETKGWRSSLLQSLSGNTDSEKASGTNVRVKGAWEHYDSTKGSTCLFPDYTGKGRKHFLAGKEMKRFANDPNPMMIPSDREKAVAGVWAKHMCLTQMRQGSKSLAFSSLNDHEKELLLWGMDNMPWGGATDGGDEADIKNRPLAPHEQKALIDDNTSGGLEAAPIVFDDMVIQTPLLNGELFPDVFLVPLDRGRRVEGVQTGTVTSSWGGVDDSAIALFNTASYVSAFDTTIYRWQGAIRIGLDFLSDTPIDFSSHITAQYGERLLEDLDDVIATGNGTTQPAGIQAAAGTSITFSSVTSVGGYESLRFGVTKPEHKGGLGSSAVFCGTETSYMRARAIPVGASDARRIFGMDYDSYSIMNRRYAINESLTNQQIFYAILRRYRMYQRRGLYFRTSTDGDTLIRNNELLIVCMARYGGQLERGACAAATSDAPS